MGMTASGQVFAIEVGDVDFIVAAVGFVDYILKTSNAYRGRKTQSRIIEDEIIRIRLRDFCPTRSTNQRSASFD